MVDNKELETIMIKAYKLTCQKCGKEFYSENPRMKKCQECKSQVIHERCKKYYQEVTKFKRIEARKVKESAEKETNKPVKKTAKKVK